MLLSTRFRSLLPGPGLALAGALVIFGGGSVGPAAAASAGGGPRTPAAMAMGTAYSAVARDYEAAHLNPANLSLAGNARASFHVLSLSGEAANSSLTVGDYKRYNGADLTDADKAAIMGKIDGDQLHVDLAADATGLSATYRGFAFTASTAAFADGGLPRDLVELLLYGNELGRTYDVGAVSGEGMSLSTASLSASRALHLRVVAGLVDELAVGATVRYMKGWYYARVVDAVGSLYTGMGGVDGTGEIVARTSDGGSGLGFDLGVAARRGPLQLGLSLHDLASRVSWENGEEVTTTLRIADVTAEDLDNGADVVDQNDETVSIGSFAVELPASLRLGAAYGLGKWLVAADYVQGWGGDGLDPQSGELAAGVEHRTLDWLRLRSGVTLGADRSPGLGLGAGLVAGAARIDLAVASDGGVVPGQGEGVGVALGIGLLFH